MAIAQTVQGQLRGAEAEGLHVFRGVRYAQAPLGQLRFRPPQPAETWQGVRDALEFGPIAPQQPIPMLEALLPSVDQPQSEDCLYLNVWTPGVDDGARPVMVWIHGGAFTIGSGSEAAYDGANLARRGDVVVVTINYRLGALGFLNLPSLGGTNFGMRDQTLALRWVQENIASFGGDPGNVTIFGESAGGMSVGSQMASPEAAGLFQKAIPQSGAGHNALTMEQSEATARRFAAVLGVDPDDAEALRAAPADQVLQASVAVDPLSAGEFDPGEDGAGATEMPFQPVVDGSFLPQRPIDAIRAGAASGVATLVGALDEEMKLLNAAALTAPEGAEVPPPPDEDAVIAALSQLHPNPQAAFNTYRAARRERGEDDSPAEILTAVIGDVQLRVPGLRLADAQAEQGGAPPVYSYLFDWKSPALNGALGSCHALELPFVFGTHGIAPDFAGSGPAADALAELTMDSWLAFAKSGDPSTPTLSTPVWDTDSKPLSVLGANPRVEHDWRGPEMSVWDGVL